eukprot:6486958-Lingulodinium_polyedra.AAC.1
MRQLAANGTWATRPPPGANAFRLGGKHILLHVAARAPPHRTNPGRKPRVVRGIWPALLAALAQRVLANAR